MCNSVGNMSVRCDLTYPGFKALSLIDSCKMEVWLCFYLTSNIHLIQYSQSTASCSTDIHKCGSFTLFVCDLLFYLLNMFGKRTIFDTKHELCLFFIKSLVSLLRQPYLRFLRVFLIGNCKGDC